jgi:hypothetical protein
MRQEEGTTRSSFELDARRRLDNRNPKGEAKWQK